MPHIPLSTRKADTYSYLRLIKCASLLYINISISNHFNKEEDEGSIVHPYGEFCEKISASQYAEKKEFITLTEKFPFGEKILVITTTKTIFEWVLIWISWTEVAHYNQKLKSVNLKHDIKISRCSNV